MALIKYKEGGSWKEVIPGGGVQLAKSFPATEPSSDTGIGATLKAIWVFVKSLLDGKVDKETGKGLSSNDYIATEKNFVSRAVTGIGTGSSGAIVTTSSNGSIQRSSYYTYSFASSYHNHQAYEIYTSQGTDVQTSLDTLDGRVTALESGGGKKSDITLGTVYYDMSYGTVTAYPGNIGCSDYPYNYPDPSYALPVIMIKADLICDPNMGMFDYGGYLRYEYQNSELGVEVNYDDMGCYSNTYSFYMSMYDATCGGSTVNVLDSMSWYSMSTGNPGMYLARDPDYEWWVCVLPKLRTYGESAYPSYSGWNDTSDISYALQHTYMDSCTDAEKNVRIYIGYMGTYSYDVNAIVTLSYAPYLSSGSGCC